MLNLGCGQYLRNPFFPGFWSQKWGCGLCILADYTRLYTVLRYGSGQTKSVDGWKEGRQNYIPPTSSGDNKQTKQKTMQCERSPTA